MRAVEDGPESQDCEAISAVLGDKHRVRLGLIPWETRCAEDLNAVTAGPPRFKMWMRTPPVDGDLAPALTVAHGRCFGRGDVLTEDGALAASYAQEALLRFRGYAE